MQQVEGSRMLEEGQYHIGIVTPAVHLKNNYLVETAGTPNIQGKLNRLDSIY